jgi:hypothetical protein
MKQNSLAIIGAVFTALLSTICCLPALLFLFFGVGGALDKILRPMSPGGYGSPYGQPTFGHGNVPMNGQNRTFTDTLSQGISNTLNSIKSGANSLFGGNNGNWTY